MSIPVKDHFVVVHEGPKILEHMFVDEDPLPVGPFTVLAPTNTAFEKLPAETVDNLLKPENKASFVNTLTYHIIAERYTSADLYDGLTQQP